MSELRRMPKKRLSVGALGVLGIIAIAIVVYFSFAKRVPFLHGYRVEAVFSNSTQLRKGSPVRVAGVDVGKVVKLSDGPGTTATVELEFKDSGLPVHQDATLRIRPRLFLEGGFYIELRPGSPSAPKLADRGTIPLGQTSVPVQFDQILTSLNRPTRESLRRTVKNLAEGTDDGAAKAFGDAARPFVPALRDTAVVAKAARGIEAHDLSTLVSSLATVTGTLAANDRALGELVSGLDTTSGVLAAEQGNVRATIRGLDSITRTSVPSLRAIDRALPSVRRFATALRPSLPPAPATLRHTAALLAQVRPLAQPAELPATLTALTPTVNGLPALSTRLRTLLPLVTPVSDCLRDRVIPVLSTPINDGVNSSGRPVWQDLVHAGVGLAGSSSSFDGNGFSVRYLAAVGDQSFATGSLPGLGQLVGLGPAVEGVSPRWLGNGVKPPVRPDAPCRDQAPVNLQSRTPFPNPPASTREGAKARGSKAAPAAPAALRPLFGPSRTRSAPPSALREALRAVATSVKGAARRAGTARGGNR
jgi:phospholipid/cholesterol/gamma-HCH transport system substrate-binding protein